MEYRQAGGGAWRRSMPMLAVEPGGTNQPLHDAELTISPNQRLFAGSVVNLNPGTEYELRLTLIDGLRRSSQRVLRCRTASEPVEPAGMVVRHVVPGAGGGDGTLENPFRGIQAAQNRAAPCDLMLLHAGVYTKTPTFNVSGLQGRPIIWRGAEDGKVIIDGLGGIGVIAVGVDDVWFENLTLRNVSIGVEASESRRLVIRRCDITTTLHGISAITNSSRQTSGFFITDNVIRGTSTWPRSRGKEFSVGIHVTGRGHVVAYNRVSGFGDGIDTYDSSRICAAIDFHNNDISECTDDGTEMDGSERNTRCYNNRYTNVFQGISFQPVFGGPCYVFRNAIYNVSAEPFKLHNYGGADYSVTWRPSGAVMYHNTAVRNGAAMTLTAGRVTNCISRNNLFLGTRARYAYEVVGVMTDCDFDYDGFAGGPWERLLKWNDVRYFTLEQLRADAPVYRHAVFMDGDNLFASGVKAPQATSTQFDVNVNDLRLRPGAAAIDAGERLPGFNDTYTGKGSDLGAYELGEPLPHYGPRM